MTFRQRLKNGEVLFGPWCLIPSPAAMNIIVAAGYDFVIIDMEHGLMSFETAENMVRAAASENVPALFRLGVIREENILRSLETGADGVITAHVENGADAREVVALAKYHPLGRRGFTPFTRAGKYSGRGDITRHAADQNQRTTVGVIVEGKEGIEGLDEILETDNLDLVYIGAYDLSQALGRPGDVNSPEVRKSLEACIRKVRDAGIAAGGFVARNRDDMAWMIDIGMQFITYLPDCAAFHLAMKNSVDEFRSILNHGGR